MFVKETPLNLYQPVIKHSFIRPVFQQKISTIFRDPLSNKNGDIFTFLENSDFLEKLSIHRSCKERWKLESPFIRPKAERQMLVE